VHPRQLSQTTDSKAGIHVKTFTAVVLALALAAASLASAAEATRESYVAAVEPICKSNTQANEKILAGVRQEVKAGKLTPAGASFLKAAAALKTAYAQLAAVPQPPADAAKLGKWLSYVKTEGQLFEKAGKALKAGQKTKAQTLVVELTHNANLANEQVFAFDFHYCELEPSKFT
jgi:hypothetical protein